MKVRTMVGLLPFCAVSVLEEEILQRFPDLRQRMRTKLSKASDLMANVADPTLPGERGSHLVSILNETNLRRVLSRLFDPEEFLSDYGIRSLYEAAQEISRRLASIFLRNSAGQRPVYGGTQKFQSDPHWRDHILFYEYFHGDNGAGLGASHQTGWTGLVALLMGYFNLATPEAIVARGSRLLAGSGATH